ncbi:MAG: type III pantothenate kinase [Candidatus Margulisbacteria bacterium]|jgi:type III pantothenate kinase|nr:type III pantothenate kinase [Candidatus Margulisiibacteriota bacterium]
MLLVIDVGNTSTAFGLFRGVRLVKTWRVATERLSDHQNISWRGSEGQRIREVRVASVVPKANKALKRQFPQAKFINYQDIGIKIKVKKPAEVGIDRLVDALAAVKLYGAPAIIVDFGTATTFDVVSAKSEYLGGAIAPGIMLSRDILHERTAKLPRIRIAAPRHVVGRSTVEALQSGLIFGYVAMVEGMIKRIKHSRYPLPVTRYKVIATGGLARLICKETDVIDIIDDNLTLYGLLLCQKN